MHIYIYIYIIRFSKYKVTLTLRRALVVQQNFKLITEIFYATLYYFSSKPGLNINLFCKKKIINCKTIAAS